MTPNSFFNSNAKKVTPHQDDDVCLLLDSYLPQNADISVYGDQSADNLEIHKSITKYGIADLNNVSFRLMTLRYYDQATGKDLGALNDYFLRVSASSQNTFLCVCMGVLLLSCVELGGDIVSYMYAPVQQKDPWIFLKWSVIFPTVGGILCFTRSKNYTRHSHLLCYPMIIIMMAFFADKVLVKKDVSSFQFGLWYIFYVY